MATRDQSQSSDRPRERTAAEAPAAEAAVERQPDEFPVDFQEWSTTVEPVLRVALAGFRHVVRQADQLRTPRLANEWRADFETFLGAEPK